MTDLLNVNPTNLDGTSSIYNYDEHMPFPTLDYIKKQINIDMSEGTGGTLNAEATVRYMSKIILNIIYDSIAYESRNKLEFLIAKSERYRKAFIDTVCAMLLTTRGKGIAELLDSGKLGKESVSKVAQAMGSILFTNQYQFVLTQDQIRSDY